MQISENRYDNMVYNKCGRSGLKLPIISFGLWHSAARQKRPHPKGAANRFGGL